MEIITFFSFKGGVGRTQALLNTACEFAQRGKKVLLMDFDLHAPGLSLMECMASPKDAEGPATRRPGVLDFFEWLVLLDEAVRRGESLPEPINLAACAYEVPWITGRLHEGAGWFKLVPAAALRRDCSDSTGYSDRVHAIDSPLSEVIRRTHRDQEPNPIVEQIRSQFSDLPDEDLPDAIFIDARTGITGIADLLLTRSSDRIVLVTGLNQQNLWGLESTLQDIKRSVETADWLRRITLVISPVPSGEHALTEAQTKRIAETLNRYVDPGEKEMFGEIGLLPNLVQIPYDAQLALLEDPILLRHEDSGPSRSYRELANRLGGEAVPLQFKDRSLDRDQPPSSDSYGPQEHPLSRVLPWDAGLLPEEAGEVLRILTPAHQPEKPYSGWLRHALNYLANSPAQAESEAIQRQALILSLSQLPVAQRVFLLSSFREERQRYFSAPRKEWNKLAHTLGEWRTSWPTELPSSKRQSDLNWRMLVDAEPSAALWSPYWTGMAEALRSAGRKNEAVDLITTAASAPEIAGQPSFGSYAIWILQMADALEQALQLAQLVLPIYRQSKSRLGEASTLKSLGDLLLRTDQLDEARARYDEALPLFREIKDRLGEANTLRSLGDLLRRTDQFDEARARYDEARPLYRQIKARLGEANTLQSLGDLLRRTGRFDEARARYDEALPLFREVKSRLGEANTLRSLGDLLTRTDQFDEARDRYDEALRLYREIKDRLGEANTLQSLGVLLTRTDQFDEARDRYDEALPLYREINYRPGENLTLQALDSLRLREEEARAKVGDRQGQKKPPVRKGTGGGRSGTA